MARNIFGEAKREKRYVPVVVRFEAEGQLRPLEIEFDEKHKYAVDRVLDVCRAACQTVGGVGVRYTVRVWGKERYLWMEKNRFFVEAISEKFLNLTKRAV